jgi:phospholipase/carboxylesterase
MLTTRWVMQSIRFSLAPAVAAVVLGGAGYAQPLPATNTYEGIAFVEEIVGATEAGPDSNAPLPLIVALHGLGDVPEHFKQVLRALPLRARLAAARAPTSFAQGYAWLPPSRPRDIDERAQPVSRAVERLTPAIFALAAARPTCGRPLVVGFSQGAMVAYGLAASPRPAISAAFPIAGYLPPSLTPAHVPAGAPRVVALHGTADSVVALRDDISSVSGLARAGYAIELRRYPGTDHTVSSQMRTDLGELIRSAARAMGCSP